MFYRLKNQNLLRTEMLGLVSFLMNQNQNIAKYHLLFIKGSSAGGYKREVFVPVGNEWKLPLGINIQWHSCRRIIKACFFEKFKAR